MTILAPSVVALQFAYPALVPYLFWVSCYFGLAAGVIAHNHNHCATFHDARANRWFGNWLSIFYGYPTFVWIPTHNRNHHKLVNTEGDATITWRFTNRHNALVAATYFFVSAYYQSVPINAFIADAKENNTQLHRRIITQYLIWGGSYAGLLGLALWLHGFKTGLFVAVMSVGLPAVFSLWAIMLFNYEQHVHTDPWSDHDHSRNFVDPVLNYLLFNNGYHSAHHESSGKHWSKLPGAHARFVSDMAPELNQKSLFGYWIKQYLLAPFMPGLGTTQMGSGPQQMPEAVETAGGALPLHTTRALAQAAIIGAA